MENLPFTEATTTPKSLVRQGPEEEMILEDRSPALNLASLTPSETTENVLDSTPQKKASPLSDEARVNVQPKARRKAVSTAVQDDNNEPMPGRSQKTARPRSKQDDSGMLIQISSPDGPDKQTSVIIPSKRISPEEPTEEEDDLSYWEDLLPEESKSYMAWRWKKMRK